jgi:hypothetical protein
MSFETFTIGISMLLYTMTGISYLIKDNWPWALVWFAYALANIGMIWAATIKK